MTKSQFQAVTSYGESHYLQSGCSTIHFSTWLIEVISQVFMTVVESSYGFS